MAAISELKYPVSFEWRNSGAASSDEEGVVQLVFKNAQSQVSVSIPRNVCSGQKLPFCIKRNDSISFPKQLSLRAEQIQNLTLKAQIFGCEEANITFTPPEKLEEGKYLLVVNSELKASFEKELSVSYSSLLAFVSRTFSQALMSIESLFSAQMKESSECDKEKMVCEAVNTCIDELDQEDLFRLLEQYDHDHKAIAHGELPKIAGEHTFNRVIEILNTEGLKKIVRNYLVRRFPGSEQEISAQRLEETVVTFRKRLKSWMAYIQSSPKDQEVAISEVLQDLAQISLGEMREPSLDSCSITSLFNQLRAAEIEEESLGEALQRELARDNETRSESLAILQQKLQASKRVKLLRRAIEERLG